MEPNARIKKTKESIMSRKKKLTGTDIFIRHDSTFRERRNKEAVWKFAQEKKEQGADVKTGYNKVTIDNQEYRYDEWRGKFFLKKKLQNPNN